MGIVGPIVRVTPRKLEPRELGKDGAPSMPWGHEWLLASTPHYTLKRLEMKKGASGPLQHHDVKDEAFIVHSGKVEVTHDNGHGVLVTVEIGPGEGFHIPPGATHKVTAVTAAVLYEASLPVFDDRVSDEDVYP